jgi:acetyltransferase-like isoleucine patch superfamily enzyme
MLVKKKRIPVLTILIFGFLPSFLKRFFYNNFKGYKISKGVKIGIGSVIIGDEVEIGEKTKIGFFTIIRAQKIKVGRFVQIGSFSYIDTGQLIIGDDSRIRENVYVAGISTPKSKLVLGKRCMIGQYSFLNPTEPIIIGNDCGIGGGAKIFTHGSYLSILEGFPVSFAQIIINNNVWIAWDVFILPGVNIGNNAVIGARSLLTRDVPSNSITSGNPAKVRVRNFPLLQSSQEQMETFNTVLEEFKEYLEFNSIHVAKKEISVGLQLEVKMKRDTSKLIFVKSELDNNKMINSQILILFHYIKDLDFLYRNYKTEMIVCLESKERIGTSLLGEELVTFLSRYGIRFNRLD